MRALNGSVLVEIEMLVLKLARWRVAQARLALDIRTNNLNAIVATHQRQWSHSEVVGCSSFK